VGGPGLAFETWATHLNLEMPQIETVEVDFAPQE